jgi:hypothetical protein
MNKALFITFLIFLSVSIASAEDVGKALSENASGEVIQSTQQLIQSGLNRDSTIDVTRAMLKHKFTQPQVIKAHQVMLEAHQQGLPPGPVINKAFEGMSKHVQAGRVISAMVKVKARYAFALQQAVQLMGEKTRTDQMVHIIASALAAGLNQKGTEAITRGLQGRSKGLSADQKDDLSIETFKMARDMARLGVISSQTETLVSQALQHQFTANQMQNLRSSMMQNSRATDPHSLAANYGKAIEQGKTFDSPGAGQMGQGANQGSMGGHGSGSGGGSGAGPGGSGSGSGGGPGGNN